MLSKEFMQFINGLDNKSRNSKKQRESNSVTKPLLYIVLKCNPAK
jgi:hypothetical protein